MMSNDVPELAQANEATVREPGIEHAALPDVDPRSQQPWSSGMMEPSQGFDPGSIPGGRNFTEGCRVPVSSFSLRFVARCLL